MNDRKLVLAVSSEERRRILKPYYRNPNTECVKGLEIWRNRKSIIKSEQFHWMLLANKISIEEFSIGIKKLNTKDIELLYEFIQSESWYTIHREILEDIEGYGEDNEKSGFEIFGRPYLNWLLKNVDSINKKTDINITKLCQETFIKTILNEITNIIKKTIIYDQAEEYQPREDSVDWFLEYAKKRFLNAHQYDRFFNDYPVLARLLATRVQYTITNFWEFIVAIEESEKELKETLDLEGSLILQNISTSQGDSHNQGKTVIQFTINEKKMFFKYKNLEVGTRLNEFYKVIEELDSSISFYKVKRIITPHYTFEECIEQEPCQSEEEILEFYQHFGEVLCVSYVLCGSDFHLENLIARGRYPVLVDVETLIQNERELINGSADNQYVQKINDSIIGTHLLPDVFYSRNRKKNMEISALSGDEQMCPFKILDLVCDNKGKMHMEYKQSIMKGAENLPILQGQKVHFKEYSKEIWEGFSTTYKVICNNQKYVEEVIKKLFAGIQVRNVLKATQKYAEILEYAYHPSYMTNFINREKLFENIWAYPYKKPIIVKYEITDLLMDDIPIFHIKTNERGIITSQREVIPSFYHMTALENVQCRLMKMSAENLQAQKNHFSIALGIFKGEVSPVCFSGEEKNDDVLKRAKQIVDYICEQIIYGSDKQDITVPTYLIDQEKNWKRNVMTYSFYDGLAGIYILLKQLTQFYPETKYFDLLSIMDNMFFNDIGMIQNMEQYVDYMSLLYIISCKLESVYNIKDVASGEKLLDEIRNFYVKNEWTDEWLFGRASLMKVCLKFYEYSGLEKSLEFAKRLGKDIGNYEMDNIGFAHGYAGLAYSLTCLLEILKPGELAENIKSKIQRFIQKIEDTRYLDDDSVNNSWCNGVLGIAYAQMKVYSIKGRVGVQQKMIKRILSANGDDDCLCHGNFGKMGLLQNLLAHRNEYVNKESILKIQTKIFDKSSFFIRGMEKEPDCGFLTGLSGVAYEYLRHVDSTIPNMLLLD
jgi:type 2 lantibiotic biosynthesis protein LanM